VKDCSKSKWGNPINRYGGKKAGHGPKNVGNVAPAQRLFLSGRPSWQSRVGTSRRTCQTGGKPHLLKKGTAVLLQANELLKSFLRISNDMILYMVNI